MRGGLQIGPNYDIAVGVTRSVSVNGVEQLASSLHFDGLSRNMMNHADLPQMQGVLMQSGMGNAANANLPATATIIQTHWTISPSQPGRCSTYRSKTSRAWSAASPRARPSARA